MKKVIRVTILLSAILLFCVPCYAKTKTRKLTDSKMTMAVGEKIKLSIPSAKQSDIQWSIKDNTLCKISKKGVLTAKKKGKTTITAKYNDAVFKIKLDIYPKNGYFNELIKENEDFKIYLYAIRHEKVYLKIINKTDKEYHTTDTQYEFDNFTYEKLNDFDIIAPYGTLTKKVEVADPDIDDYDELDYSYTGGKFTGVFQYYEKGDGKYKSINFSFKK